MSALEQFAIAIETENVEKVKSLIESAVVDGNANLSRLSSLHIPALIFAVARGKVAIVDILLVAGANVDAVNYWGDSAVHVACSLPDSHVAYKMLKLLLAYRPRLDVKNYCSLTALHYCIQCNKHDFVVLLIDAGSPFTGIDVDRPMSGGLTCTHLAAVRNCNNALVRLINIGSDVDCLSSNRCSPLDMASKYTSIVLLLAAGADVNNSNKKTLVHRAIFDMGVVQVEEELVKKARKDIVKARLDFVRYRAFTVCVALQSLKLPALQTCEILLFACGPIAPLISFHQWWQIATTVKHFSSQ